MVMDLLFQDKAINKLSIKEGNRINFKFKDIKTSFLNGLILRYSSFKIAIKSHHFI